VPQISVQIDGKSYRMACDDGQEEHLAALAGKLDGYVTHLRGSFGEIGDLRLTVMAGIMIMDELSEIQKRVKGLESEIVTLRKTRDDALSRADQSDKAVVDNLSALADRLENLGQSLGAKPRS
jgi:cell division protein ZapA